MRTSTTAGVAATIAAGLAVALLAVWCPTATAGAGRETAPTQPALVSGSSGGGVDRGSVPPTPPSDDRVAGSTAAAPSAQGSPSPVPALEEPVANSRPPTSRAASPDPDTAVSSPALPYDPGYWTPERMASAKPMPMPSPG